VPKIEYPFLDFIAGPFCFFLNTIHTFHRNAIMITRRDLAAAVIGVAATLSIVTFAQSETSVMRSGIYDWNEVAVKQDGVRTVRDFFQAPTATLDELELHVSTLQAGDTSHAPHRHPNEELVIVKDGTVEALVNGELKRVGAGSVIFNASNELHGIRNVGSGPATYHVINWHSPGMKK
jgi:quercetin dioxygenase-like cupin family protein